MACGLMRHLLPAKTGDTLRVESAGIYATDGLGASSSAVEVCGDDGVDISTHLSRQLTVEAVQGVDLILTMELIHKHYIINYLHGTSKNLFCLREFTRESMDGIELSIIDPAGLPIEMYRKVYYEIKYELFRILPAVIDRFRDSTQSSS